MPTTKPRPKPKSAPKTPSKPATGSRPAPRGSGSPKALAHAQRAITAPNGSPPSPSGSVRTGSPSIPKKGLPSPLYFVLHGPPGVGKTSFAAEFEDVGFIVDPQEQGIRNLVDYRQAKSPVWIEDADNFAELLVKLDKVADGKLKGIKTLAIDSLTGMEKLCFIHHCAENFDNDWTAKGFYAFQGGPRNAAKTDWPLLIDMLTAIHDAGISICLIGHSEVRTFNNPEGADFDRYQPYLHKDIWQLTSRWAQAVLFYNYSVDVEKKGLRTKAREGTDERFIYTQWSPAYDAKNCYGLPPLIKADSSGEAYAAFMGALNKCLTK